ncbi:MAG: hypothetical protein ABIH72_02055 [archaeon]
MKSIIDITPRNGINPRICRDIFLLTPEEAEQVGTDIRNEEVPGFIAQEFKDFMLLDSSYSSVCSKLNYGAFHGKSLSFQPSLEFYFFNDNEGHRLMALPSLRFSLLSGHDSNLQAQLGRLAERYLNMPPKEYPIASNLGSALGFTPLSLIHTLPRQLDFLASQVSIEELTVLHELAQPRYNKWIDMTFSAQEPSLDTTSRTAWQLRENIWQRAQDDICYKVLEEEARVNLPIKFTDYVATLVD